MKRVHDAVPRLCPQKIPCSAPSPHLMQNREFPDDGASHREQEVALSMDPLCCWGLLINISTTRGTNASKCTVGMPSANDAPPHSQGLRPFEWASLPVHSETRANATINKTVLPM